MQQNLKKVEPYPWPYIVYTYIYYVPYINKIKGIWRKREKRKKKGKLRLSLPVHYSALSWQQAPFFKSKIDLYINMYIIWIIIMICNSVRVSDPVWYWQKVCKWPKKLWVRAHHPKLQHFFLRRPNCHI